MPRYKIKIVEIDGQQVEVKVYGKTASGLTKEQKEERKLERKKAAKAKRKRMRLQYGHCTK